MGDLVYDRAPADKKYRSRPEVKAYHHAYYLKHSEKIKAYKKAHNAEHKTEIAAKVKQYRLANKAKLAAARRKTLFGLSEKDYLALLERQGGGCGICGSLKPGHRLLHFPVDHDHVTGLVRGLLCHNCNVGLGMFRDSDDLLLMAAGYLRAHA